MWVLCITSQSLPRLIIEMIRLWSDGQVCTQMLMHEDVHHSVIIKVNFWNRLRDLAIMDNRPYGLFTQRNSMLPLGMRPWSSSALLSSNSRKPGLL